MAKYTVTHTCGHRSDRTLYGKHSERDRKLAWWAGQPCAVCIRAEETRRAQAHAGTRSLPDLIGTEKQIAWAERIRYHTWLILDRLIPATVYGDTVPIPEDRAFVPGETTTIGAVLANLAREDSARWWIDNAKRVQDVGRVPLYTDKEFSGEVMRKVAWGERAPTTSDLADSGDVRKQIRGLYQ